LPRRIVDGLWMFAVSAFPERADIKRGSLHVGLWPILLQK